MDTPKTSEELKEIHTNEEIAKQLKTLSSPSLQSKLLAVNAYRNEYKEMTKKMDNDKKDISKRCNVAVSENFNKIRAIINGEVAPEGEGEAEKVPLKYFWRTALVNSNYFDINENTTNGILGLARNYTSDVVVAESYLFGVSASFSIMNYLTSNKLLNVSMFSIYKDKLILGDVPIAKENRNNVKICKPINFLDETFELFFWNCETNFINIFGVTEESRFGEYFIIDTLLKGINLPLRLKEKVGEYLNKVTNSKCTVKGTIICDGSIDIDSIGNVSLTLKGNITLTIPSYELFYKSYDQYHSLVTFSEYNHMYIIGGKLLTNKYFLMFNNKDNYIGFADINSIRLILTNETADIIIKVNILFLLIQITMLLYFKINNLNNK